jgi:HAE1 family hydrophobic/amphiphilic exporter-1
VYWLAEICVRRPVFALMIVTALVVAGIASFPQLGVDRYPSMDLPSVYVRTTYLGAASEEVESEVSQVIEDAVATVSGIEELRSISSDGQSFVIVTFNLNRNLDAAVQDVRDAVASVANRLPPGLDPPVVQKQDTDSSPIITLAVAGPRTPSELFLMADRFVKNVIESSPGVGQVVIAGAADRAVQVNVDARRLAAHELSILQVREALAGQNAEVPGGRVNEGRTERSLRTLGRVPHARDFPDLVVSTVGGTAIRLSDLGEVRDATKEVRTLARLDGRPAVVLQVQRQSGENTVRVIEAVKERLERSRELLPDDVEVIVIQDQSRYILAALHEIEGHLISGSILACITVLLFMRSWRSTLIAGVAIPASIIATFAFMKWFGFTLNNVTMLALVLMVGVVIDDAIVVLENVFQAIEEKGMDPIQASIEGTREIGPAVLATTLSLVIVFLPVSFLSSVTGRMLYEFGITATVAIMVSMLVSFTLTPMMCSKLLTRGMANPNAPTSRGGFYYWIDAGYMWLLRLSMRFRWVVLLLSVLTIAANWPLYQMISQDYIPTNVDESEFEVSIYAPEGASLVSMDEVLAGLEKDLQEMPGIELVLATVGTRGFGGVNRGEIYVRLQDIETRTFSLGRLWRGLLKGDPGETFRGNFSQRDMMTQVRSMTRQYDELRISVRNLTSLRQGAPVDIDYSITGPDIDALSEFSEKMRLAAEKIPGIVDVDTTLKLDKPELLVHIDRERAATLGVSASEIAETLRVAVGGDDRVSRYRDKTVDDAYDVELRLVGIDRADVESISQLYVRANPRLDATGGPAASAAMPSQVHTRIDNVVTFEFGESAARIDRLDRQRMVAVRANIAGSYALSDRIDAMNQAAQEIGLPPGFETRVMGRGRELERTLQDFVWTFLLSFVFMYIVLAAQYEHLVHPFTILLSLPLAVPFGLISLYWGGESLNLYSALGILVLFGVVKKASILQVDHTNHLRSKGMNRLDAILQANRDRLRPILMTTISFVAGLLPLLISTGPGAEERRSIAVLAVGGQTLSLLLTLLAIPVIYSYLDDLGAVLHRLITPRTPLATAQVRSAATLGPEGKALLGPDPESELEAVATGPSEREPRAS